MTGRWFNSVTQKCQPGSPLRYIVGLGRWLQSEEGIYPLLWFFPACIHDRKSSEAELLSGLNMITRFDHLSIDNPTQTSTAESIA